MTQDDALQVLTMGKNVFLTGAAGSGKTYVLNRYIEWLRDRGIEPAITASTGIAATHIGGTTVHSWSGIGIKDHLSAYDLDRVGQKESLVKRLTATRVLIVDEVSMLSARTLEMVDQVIRAGTRRGEPFGGIQVVLCGDFFQLPPVVRGHGEGVFAFTSTVWRDLDLHTCYLTEQFRQSDGALLSLLNSIREGDVTDELAKALAARVGTTTPDDIPYLYTHNVDVDKLNNDKLLELPGKMHRFDMRTSGSKKYVSLLLKGVLVPETLQLKKSAVVMFVKNHPQGQYVNGTLGTVSGFEGGVPLVRIRKRETIKAEPVSWTLEDGEKVRAELVQVPLRLAWAVTVHKSQGLSLDAARMDLRRTFAPGQGYVALSRVRTLDGIYLEGMTNLVYARHPDVALMDRKFQAQSVQIERRLQSTAKGRVSTLSERFVEQMGGHPPDPSRRRRRQSRKSTYDKTRDLIREGYPLAEVLQVRKLSRDTVLSHIERLLSTGALTQDDIEYLCDEQCDPVDLGHIETAFRSAKTWNLAPVRRALNKQYSYEQIRFARLFIRDWVT